MSQSQWVWSDLFAWKNVPWANDRCNKWHLEEPNPDKFTGICIKRLVYHARCQSKCILICWLSSYLDKNDTCNHLLLLCKKTNMHSFQSNAYHSFQGDSSLQPCPRILTQAMADRGRFMSEEECNPSNRNGCARYHEGAVHCFKMVIPRSAFNLYMYLHKLYCNAFMCTF